MKSPVTSRGLQIIAIVTMLGVAAVLLSPYLSQHFGPYALQQHNMAAAEAHIVVVEPLVHTDSRFTNITFAPYTAEDGSLLVRGYVMTDRDLRDLKRIVESSKPPVRTAFIVDVIPPELRLELQKGAQR